MNPIALSTRVVQVSLALALLSPAIARAQSYACSSALGTHCRTLINDGWYTNQSVSQPGSAASTLLVLPGACPQQDRVVDLDLQLHVLHPYIGDLEVVLTHPDGTAVSVLYRPGISIIDGYCPNDDVDLTFDDDDGVKGFDMCRSTIPALRESLLPFNPLSVFDGKVRNGTWTLTLRDHVAGNEGVLLGWRLELPCVADLPDVTIDTTDAVASERGPDDRAIVTVMRGGDTAGPLEVEYVVTGSASLADFEELAGKVTIAVGAAAATIELRAVADNHEELAETVQITLLPTAHYEVGGRGSAFVTLLERSGEAGSGGRGDAGDSSTAAGSRAGSAGGGGESVDGSADPSDAGPDGGDDFEKDDGCDCRMARGSSNGPRIVPLGLAVFLVGLGLRRRKRR